MPLLLIGGVGTLLVADETMDYQFLDKSLSAVDCAISAMRQTVIML